MDCTSNLHVLKHFKGKESYESEECSLYLLYVIIIIFFSFVQIGLLCLLKDTSYLLQLNKYSTVII